MIEITQEENTTQNKYIQVGTIQEAKFKTIEYGETNNGTPFIKFILENRTGQTCETVWWLTTQAVEKYTGPRIGVMLNRLGKEQEALHKVNINQNAKEFVEALTPILLSADWHRWAFGGEETEYNGKKFFRARILNDKFNFVESLQVPIESSKLKVDSENPFHFKRLESTTTPASTTEDSNGSNFY
jgi:hypothetical protein